LAILLFVCATLPGCAGKTVSTSDYLGDYSYDAPLTAMMYEDFDGEGEGIVYREVTDYDKLIGYTEVPVVIYFYTSYQEDGGTATAMVEEFAETYHDQILFVSADTLQTEELTRHFNIGATPDFVLLHHGALVASFEAFDGKAWTQSDLENWILTNSGIG
jgi:Thioredoxin